MGIGIGGGLGPFRAGVSTRGVGGGIGPLSAGTSWGAMGSLVVLGVGALALIFMIALVYWVLAWPYELGLWIGGELGAGSDVSKGLGWGLETIYLVGVTATVITVGVAQDRRATAQAEEERRREANAAAHARYERQCVAHAVKLDELRGYEDGFVRYLESFPRIVAGIEATRDRTFSHPRGHDPAKVGKLSVPTPDGELLIGTGEASLCAPRVVRRGFPKEQTEIEDGDFLVSDRAIYFYGDTRTDVWPLARVLHVTRDGGRILITLANRKTISGLSAPKFAAAQIEALITWARELPHEPIEARRKLDELIAAEHAERQGHEARLNKTRRLIAEHLAAVPKRPEDLNCDPATEVERRE